MGVARDVLADFPDRLVGLPFNVDAVSLCLLDGAAHSIPIEDGAVHLDTHIKINQISNVVPLRPNTDDINPPSIPGVLDEVLFGGDAHSFVILDAAKIPNLTGILDGENLEHACLFNGQAAEEYGEVAPWLARIGPDDRIVRFLFSTEPQLTALWSRQAAIFMRSQQTLPKVKDHLRRLTKVRSATGAEVYFRFWDPVVAYEYFSQISDWPERIESIFRSRHATITDIIAVKTDSYSARHFSLKVDDRSPLQQKPVQLEDRDHMIFTEMQMPRLAAELSAWLLRGDPARFRGFREPYRMALAEHAVREGRKFNFQFKEEFAYFLYMMWFLGGWFHIDPQYSDIVKTFKQTDDARYSRMRHAFPGLYQQIFEHRARPLDLFEGIYERIENHIAFRRGWNGITAEDVLDIVVTAERMLGMSREQIANTRHAALTEATRLGLTERREQLIFYLHWICLGTHFHQDPMSPWAGEKLFAFGSANDGIIPLARYACRRLRRVLISKGRLSYDHE